MKFFCHLKIIDQDLARTTFAVMHDSFSTFYVSPIQNASQKDLAYLSAFTLYKKDKEWSYELATPSKPVPESLIAEVSASLDRKLEKMATANTANWERSS